MTSTGFTLGLALDAGHPAGWSRSSAATLDPARFSALIRTVERAGSGYAVLAGAPLPSAAPPELPGRLDAVQRAAFAGPLTSRLGLVAQAEVVFSEPFHVATQLASLDYAAEGRAGWWVAASGAADLAAGYGRPAVSEPELLRREANDVIEVSRRLWDSWEDDAVIRDRTTGRYLDGNKVHHIDFTGETFAIRGPLITPRPPQGRPVIFAHEGVADPSGVDVTVINAATDGAAAAAADRVRRAGTARAVIEIEVVLDQPSRSAADRLAELDREAPWPGDGRLRYAGDAAGLVELLRRLSGAVDGVLLQPAELVPELEVLERAVLPALREHGLAAPPRDGGTLRETFGLPRPVSRYAVPAGRTAERS